MDSPTPDRLGEIYESIQPRMATHKRNYLRTRFGAALAAPLLLVGGAVYAANADRTVSQVADGGGVPLPVPEFVEDEAVPEDEEPATPEDEQESALDQDPGQPAADSSEPAEDAVQQDEQLIEIAPPAEGALAWQTVSLGLAGSAEVGVEGEKHLTLGDLDLNDGWEAIQIHGKDRYIVLQLSNGDVKLLLTLKVKISTGDMKVKFEDLAPAEEEEEAEQVEHAPKPAPPAPTDGTSYSSAGGSVYVSRSGQTLSISVTGTSGGFSAQTLYNNGAMVKVQFTDGETYIYVMGTIEGDKIAVGEWTEHHAPLYESNDKDKGKGK